MTLGDLFKRLDISQETLATLWSIKDLEKDRNKMIIFRDGIGWSNVDFAVNDNEITATLDTKLPFSDE